MPIRTNTAKGALLCALILFVSMLCVASPLLYHPDNITFPLALYLNDTPSPHWAHPSYLLAFPLCWLSKWLPFVNVYEAYLYLLLLGSAAVILYVSGAKGGILSPMGIAGVGAACYITYSMPMSMEYARISFVAAGCGCALIFHSLYQERSNRLVWLSGVALFLGGLLLRHDSSPGFLPFIGMASLFCLQKEKTGKEWLVRNLAREVVPIALFVAIIAVLAFQSIPARGVWQEEGNLMDVNAIRISYVDYPDYSDEDKSALYAAENIAPEEIDLLEKTFFRDNALMTTAWWKTMGEIRQKDNPGCYAGMRTFVYAGGIVLLWRHLALGIVVLAVWGMCIRKGKWRLYPLAMLFAYAFGVLVCCARARCHFTPIMSLTYFYIAMQLVPCGVQTEWKSIRRCAWILGVCTLALMAGLAVFDCIYPYKCDQLRVECICLLALLSLYLPVLAAKFRKVPAIWVKGSLFVLFVACIMMINTDRIMPLGGFRHTYAAPAERKALEGWCNGHPDQIFLMDCYVYRSVAYPDTALLNPKASFIPNVVEIGNWPSTLPYREMHRRRHGLDNEVFALFHPQARFVSRPWGSKRIPKLLHYLRDHYGVEVSFEMEQQLTDNLAVFRVSSHQVTK